VDGASLGSDTSSPFTIEWDTSKVADGSHAVTARASDAAGNTTVSVAAAFVVKNNVTFALKLSPAQEFPSADSGASGEATINLNLATGVVSGSLTVQGMTATAAHIHDGFAGVSGPVLIGLTARSGTPNAFDLPANTTLTTDQMNKLLAGQFYLNAHSAAYPNGEVRGQVTPDNVLVLFTDMSGRQEIEAVEEGGRGRAALTVNLDSRATVAHVWFDNLNQAKAVHLSRGNAGVNGASVLDLVQDTASASHWLTQSAVLAQSSLDALVAGGLYFGADTVTNPNGAVRGQVAPPDISVAFAKLEGLQEVPDVDTTATGTGAVTINRTAGIATIHVTTRNLSNAVAAHLHTGPGGVTGPVTIGLTQDGSNPNHWFAEVKPISATDLAAFDAGGTYVNVHTQANSGGEIRGQVVPPDVLYVVSRLSATQEVPTRAAAGKGVAAVTARRSTKTVSINLNTTGVDDAVAAHMHYAFAGVNGPVAVGLSKNVTDPKRWSVSGAPLTDDQLDDLEHGEMYVNVHTPANPGGEIRGQLAPDDIRVVFTSMSGAEEVPAAATTASGLAATTVDLARKMVAIQVRTTGVDDATASHIHRAARGTAGGVIIPLTKDANDPQHWSAEDKPVTDAQIADFLGGLWYINVHTPAFPSGAIRGQIGLAALPTPPPPPPADTTPPTVALTAPPATVSGTLTLAATATDNVGVTSVRFLVNGSLVGTASAAPYTVSWDTTTVVNGPATVVAEARDSAGNFGQSPTFSVAVNNAPPVTPDTTPPTVVLTAPPAQVSGTITLTATAQDNVGVTGVRFLVNGVPIGTDATAPYSLLLDTTTVSDGQVTLSADASDAAGNVGQSVPVTVTVSNVVAVTLTQLQSTIFTPHCSGCHTGGGGGLPSSMNLSSRAATFAALVNVASVEQSGVLRVMPGDASASYVVRKLEGDASITGVRMPQGGPFLSAAEIDKVKQWINAGASNN